MITLKKGQYLSNVLDKIPTDCILSKRIPGCGATTLELLTDRNSIIIVPNVPVIKSKEQKFPNMKGVYEDVKVNDVVAYLRGNSRYKIMTTPESFGKIKIACEKCGINIYSEFFLLMDECHQLIKDVDYRKYIVLPMTDFFRFKNKAMVSATPLGFSDPRLKNFETIEVRADYNYQQDIMVINTYNTTKAIDEYLDSHQNRTVCFFVNSIAQIYSIMKHFNLLNDSTAKRCYRDALPLDDCFRIIEQGIGSDFDPQLATLFLCAKERVVMQFIQNTTPFLRQNKKRKKTASRQSAPHLDNR